MGDALQNPLLSEPFTVSGQERFFFPRRLSLEPQRLALPLDAEDQQDLEALIAAGHAERRDGQIILTRKGMLVADQLVSHFLTGAEERKAFKLVQ